MTDEILYGISLIIITGVSAQWFAARFKIPSILVLLICGFVMGPVTHLLDPNHLFGEFLFPMVSLSVAIVLFEGGLSLSWAELGEHDKTVGNLVSIGVLVTWVLGSLAAYYITDLGFSLSVLIGAILVVSGPTVVMPLLRFVRPVGRIGPIIKWEGIVNDPVGAALAVLVFEAILTGGVQGAANVVILGIFRTIFVGVGSGWLGAQLIIVPLKRYWIPDYLQNSMVLMIVILNFTLSNSMQTDSGLLTVTVMGVFIANQKGLNIKHIIEFDENLRVLIIGALFVVLAARLEIETLILLGPSSLLFVAFLIIVVRPLAVVISTAGSGLSWREKAFLSWMAPRGIVAAAVSALFALGLEEEGFARAEEIVSLTFLVIVATVAIYGLSAAPLGRWLKVAHPNPQGIIVIGAHSWALEIAKVIQAQGVDVLIVDSNLANIQICADLNIPAHHGNALSEHIFEAMELGGMGRLLALTPNDEVNSLAALNFIEVFGRSEVYQLALNWNAAHGVGEVAEPLRGRCLFNQTATYAFLGKAFDEGAKLQTFDLNEDFTYADFKRNYENTIPMFLIDKAGFVTVFTDDNVVATKPNQSLISLVNVPLND